MADTPRFDIEKMTTSKGILFLLTALLFFAPGIVTVFLYFPSLFETAETLKILMLSIGLTMPSFLLVFLFAGTNALEKERDSKNFHFNAVNLSAVITAVGIYVALGVSYWRDYSFDGFLVAELLVTLAVIVVSRVLFWLEGCSEKEGE